MSMITVSGLVKSFGDNVVLDGIDFAVNEGEVVSIIGPSGSGKSTLLRCLNLLEKPNAGEITINATSITAPGYTHKQAHALRAQTAMVFQSYNLFRNKTALQNVTESLIFGKKMRKAEAERIGKELLDRVGLADHSHKFPVTMSGGQQQRVSIARALAVAPKAVLFDEPTSALDPELVGEVLEVIGELAAEHMTMIIVTHEMNFARQVSDRVIFMAEGDIVQFDAPDVVLLNSENPRTRRFLKQLPPSDA